VRYNIRWRLTLWNTLALALVLTSFAALIYGLLRHALLEQVDSLLQTNIAQIQGDTRIEADTEQRLRYLIEEFKEHQNMHSAVYRADGTLYMRTAELAESSVPSLPAGSQDRWEYNASLPIIGRQRVLAQQMRFKDKNFIVMLLAPLEAVDRELAEVRSVLLTAGPAAMLLSGGLAYWLARKAQSFHPLEHHFEGPQNKRRYDFWQWAMEAMVTYGPDVNVSIPDALSRRFDHKDLSAKVNYYAPALTALTAASPLYRGDFWRIRGRIGKSVRTYYRSATAPPLEIHPEEALRLELKPLEMSWRLEDYHNYFLVWLELLLDEELHGRASNETRIYDLGAVARHGVTAETVTERAGEVLDRAPKTLADWGFETRTLTSFRERLDTSRVPADKIIEVFEREQSIPAVLRQFAGLTRENEQENASPSTVPADSVVATVA
jgi:hypothetical protein